MNNLDEFSRRLNSLFSKEDKTYLRHLNDFFLKSSNLFSDVLSLLGKFSANYPKVSGIKSSLPYIIVQQLDHFVKTSEFSSELVSHQLPPTVRWNALLFAIKKKNKTWFDTIVDVYQLKSIDTERILEIVNNSLAEKKFFEASLIVIKFELKDNYDIKQILVPLLFQDKISVVDDYIRGDEKTHGFQLIEFLDECYVSRSYGESIVCQIPDARSDKLQPKALQKLVTRLLKQHNIDESACPNIIGRRNDKQMRYLVHKKYSEGGFSEGSWIEMITNTVADNKELHEEFVMMLVSYGDFNEAIKWANRLELPLDKRPHCIRDKTEDNTQQNNSWDGWNDEEIKEDYFDLKLSLIQDIHWINTDERFQSFIDQIIEGSNVIGMDGEWPPILGPNTSTQKLTLLQIASYDSCFLIDVLKLKDSKLWTAFTDKLLNSKSIMKIGYGFHNDLTLIKQSFSIETEFKPQNVFDLSKVIEFVLSEYQNLIDDSSIAEARRKDLKGLSKCVFLLFGKPLDKSEQFSDWSRRPLREEQVKYAALDAFVLIEIFDELRKRFNENNYDFDEFVDNFLNGKLRRVEKRLKLNDNSSDEIEIIYETISVRQFRAVVDTMLQGLGRYLRICGADVIILETNDDHHKAARIAMDQRRVLLTCGAPYEQFKSRLSNGLCYRVNNNASAYEQMEMVLRRFKVKVNEEDLFTRCPKCNSNEFDVFDNIKIKDLYKNRNSRTKTGALIKFEDFHITVFEKVQEFLVCTQCGKVYWEGCHQNRWKDKIKNILFPNETEKSD